MDTESLAWAAGFFDAEGSFSAANRYPFVFIGNTNESLLRRFRTVAGVGSVNGPYTRHTKEFRRRPQWAYQLYGEGKVVPLAAAMWPWLGTYKRGQIFRILGAVSPTPSDEAASDRPGDRREALAWAAGFFDGEGCFSHSKKSTMCARITSTDPELLERFKNVIGFGKLYGPYAYHGGFGSKKPRYVYTTTGYEQLQAILALIWFQLGREKRDKAIGILDRYLTFYACGHEREDARWHKHCPQCFRPGPKPKSRTRTLPC